MGVQNLVARPVVWIYIGRDMDKENITPNMGEAWVHIKTGNIYKVLRMVRLKINGKWEIGVAYMDDPSTDLFVRECFDDFMEKFVREKNYTNPHTPQNPPT